MTSADETAASESAIRELGWRADDPDRVIEIGRRSALLDRYPREHFERVERLRFHVVLVGDHGHGLHEVDFEPIEIAPRRVVHIEPGQVHRWRPEFDFDAHLIAFQEPPHGLPPAWAFGTTPHLLVEDDWVQAQQVLRLIADEERLDRSPTERFVAMRALRDLLFVRLGLGRESSLPEDLPDAYAAFRRDLETDLSVATSMIERAARVGYSARTISRACADVTGRTAKQLVDERLILEARRMLAQPGATSAGVARRLGFSEATNFAKYFRRHNGRTPSEWITESRPSASNAPR